MRFTISGQHSGRPASITWDDGELSGDAAAVEAFRQMAEERDVVGYPLVGILSTSDHLSKPLATSILLFRFLHPVTEWSGQVPDLPPIPPGAVS